MKQQGRGISGLRMDRRIARLNALWVTLALAVYLALGPWWIPAFLAIDFLLRGFLLRRLSPIGALSRGVVALLNGPPQLQWAAPKIFAAKLGCAFSLLALLLHLGGAETTAKILATGFIALTSLEAFAGYCVACRLHSMFHRIRAAQRAGEVNHG